MTESFDVSPGEPRLDVAHMSRLAPDLFCVSTHPPVRLADLPPAPANPAPAATPGKHVPRAR